MMKSLLAAVAALAMLTSCSEPTPMPPASDLPSIAQPSPAKEQPIIAPPLIQRRVASDGHVWEGKEYSNGQVFVTVVEHKSAADIWKAYLAEGGEDIPGTTLQAFTVYNTKAMCTIHILDPDLYYEPEVIGHEFMHCVHGNFHPNHLKRILAK